MFYLFIYVVVQFYPWFDVCFPFSFGSVQWEVNNKPSPPRSRMSIIPTLGDALVKKNQISPDTGNLFLSIAHICPHSPHWGQDIDRCIIKKSFNVYGMCINGRGFLWSVSIFFIESGIDWLPCDYCNNSLQKMPQSDLPRSCKRGKIIGNMLLHGTCSNSVTIAKRRLKTISIYWGWRIEYVPFFRAVCELLLVEG